MSNPSSMAEPLIKKRSVVLSLAELQKYPTLNDRYAATLPFKWKRFDCYCSGDPVNYGYLGCCGASPPLWFSNLRAKCIKQTGERWAWFSSARLLDNTCGGHLGTLIYLPWEIRQKIIKELFDEAFYWCDIDNEEWITSGVFSPSDRFDYHHEDYYGLWLASPSTRFEMEHYYFSNTRFLLSSPKDLECFADQSSTRGWGFLRSVTLDVSRDWGYNSSLRDWMSACARLPPNLASIQIKVWTWHLKGAEIHGQWFLVNRGPVDPPDTKLGTVITFVNTLGKLAHRVAAKAKIGLAVTEYGEADELRHTHHRVLDDLEPWSKNWLDWWEEETKVDFEGDKAFNKAA